MKRCLHLLLVVSLLLPTPPVWADPPKSWWQATRAKIAEGTDYLRKLTANEPELLAEVRSAVAEDVTRLTIQVRRFALASDEELPAIREAIHEGEHAVEPPTHAEGFWARRLEVIRHPFVALDLRRSFQNVRRLMRVSHNFENPFIRKLLMVSAGTFGATHGGEVFTGVTLGTKHAAQAVHHFIMGDTASAWVEVGIAMSWYGLALPGLYDVGCWGGQAAIVFRPYREGAFYLGQLSMRMVGKAGSALGLPAVLQAIFESQPARAKILEALENGGPENEFEITIRDEDLLKFSFELDGLPVFDLQFEENAAGELILRRATIEAHELKALTYAQLKEAVGVFGWNVLGVFRQFRKLLLRGHKDLIEEEHTFVHSVKWVNAHRFDVEFRDNAVFVGPKRRFQPAFVNECVETLAMMGEANVSFTQ